VVGESLASCTQQVQFVQCFDSQGRRIILVDTPGFNDTKLSDLDVLELIANWLKETWVLSIVDFYLSDIYKRPSYQGGKLLSGLLFLHRISDNRMGSSPLRLLETFKGICGNEAFKNVVLVTTMWDVVTTEEGATREEELRGKYWKHMLALGSRTERFFKLNTKASAWDIISGFGPETRRLLQLQDELVNKRKPLSETTAGRPLFAWLIGVVRFVQKAVEALQRKLRKAKKLERQLLQEDVLRQQNFLEAANLRLGRYNTVPVPKFTDTSLRPSTQRPPMPSCLTPLERSRLTVTTRSEPPSTTTTMLSTASELIDPCLLRTKIVDSFKVIRQYTAAFPISGLCGLVDMVVKIGEMIEVESRLSITIEGSDLSFNRKQKTRAILAFYHNFKISAT
jgi:hypothetical protein